MTIHDFIPWKNSNLMSNLSTTLLKWTWSHEHCHLYIKGIFLVSLQHFNHTCFCWEGSWLHIFPRIFVTSWKGRSWFSARTFSRCSFRNLTYPVRGALGAFMSLSGFFLFFPFVNIVCKIKVNQFSIIVIYFPLSQPPKPLISKFYCCGHP